MPIRLYNFPEHDLSVLVARGKHTSKDVIHAYQALDSTYATRWVKYLDPTADMSEIDLAHVPAMRRAKGEKRRELFGDNPKPAAIVCGSKVAEQFFIEFWRWYSESNERCFRSLDEAYDWLGLSEAARAVVARAIDADIGARWTGGDPTALEPNESRAVRGRP